MNFSLLTNKLKMPVLSGLVHRPELVEMFQLQQPTPLIVVQATAGYGKTSALCDWLNHSQSHVCWYTLDSLNNIPSQFWRYLCECLSQLDSGISEEALNYLANQAVDDVMPVCDSMIAGLNHFTRNRLRPNHCVLVLDDFHFIDDKDILASLKRFIDYKPYWLQVVIATRTLPDIQLAKRISQQQAWLIGNEALAFSKETCNEVITNLLGTIPTTETLDAIYEKSEGWPAAVQLLSTTPNTLSLSNVESHQDLISDYMFEEVFSNLDENTQALLKQICIIPRFNFQILNEVIETPVSQNEFEGLIHSGLVQSTKNNENDQILYKIQDIFREWLERTFENNEPEAANQARESAIRSLIKYGALNDAFIIAINIKDWPLASNLLGKITYGKYVDYRFDYLNFLLEKFPEEQITLLPTLSIIKANICFQQYKHHQMYKLFESGKQALDNIDHELSSTEPKEAILNSYGFMSIEEVEIVKTTLIIFKDITQVLEGRFENLESLNPDFTVPEEHPLAIWLDYICFFQACMNERYEESISLGVSALDKAKSKINVFCVISTAQLLSLSLFVSGQNKKAINMLLETIDWLKHLGALDSPNIPSLYGALGNAYIEDMQFDKAEEMYQLVEENVTEFSDPRFVLIQKYHFRLKLLMSTKQFEKAVEWIHVINDFEDERLRHQPNIDAFNVSPETNRFEMLLQLKMENAMPIIQWALNYQAPKHNTPMKQNVDDLLVATGLMLCGQDQFEKLDELIEVAKHNGDHARYVFIKRIKSMFLSIQGQKQESDKLFLQCLKIGLHYQFKELMLDGGPLLIERIKSYQDHPEVGTYCQMLVQADYEKTHKLTAVTNQVDDQSSPQISQESIDKLSTLTKRESEILDLLAKGMRNQEIANQLAISLATVKRHIQNIYSKLGINSRTEAALLYSHA